MLPLPAAPISCSSKPGPGASCPGNLWAKLKSLTVHLYKVRSSSGLILPPQNEPGNSTCLPTASIGFFSWGSACSVMVGCFSCFLRFLGGAITVRSECRLMALPVPPQF